MAEPLSAGACSGFSEALSGDGVSNMRSTLIRSQHTFPLGLMYALRALAPRCLLATVQSLGNHGGCSVEASCGPKLGSAGSPPSGSFPPATGADAMDSPMFLLQSSLGGRVGFSPEGGDALEGMLVSTTRGGVACAGASVEDVWRKRSKNVATSVWPFAFASEAAASPLEVSPAVVGAGVCGLAAICSAATLGLSAATSPFEVGPMTGAAVVPLELAVRASSLPTFLGSSPLRCRHRASAASSSVA
mmetsp:Transcript_90008/g.253865  ORF Transcript_90008/g.253865 Transcript_90008/m.253865 type:complete len:246 (+) Transcript_90008:92-829(+)